MRIVAISASLSWFCAYVHSRDRLPAPGCTLKATFLGASTVDSWALPTDLWVRDVRLFPLEVALNEKHPFPFDRN
jgi:hypothetical protein